MFLEIQHAEACRAVELLILLRQICSLKVRDDRAAQVDVGDRIPDILIVTRHFGENVAGPVGRNKHLNRDMSDDMLPIVP